MKIYQSEVVQYINEEDVKFIRMAFCDIFGRQKNISVMPGEFEKVLGFGKTVDGSSIDGFGNPVRSDLVLHPDPETLSVLPWRPEHGRVVRMFCDITNSDGVPCGADTRHFLKKAIKKAEDMGVSFAFGSEMKFYLFKRDEYGNPTAEPYDNAGYMEIAPEDKGENVRREICLTLEQMGIEPESSHHEHGPGQNEIAFKYSSPLNAADNAVTFKSVVNTVSARNGLYADFSPKPIKNCVGSGMHIHFSAKSKDNSDIMPYVIGGIMEHINEITAFLNTTESSYERLSDRNAPKFISWSKEDRSRLIRIPASESGNERAELRSPDSLCNPYLAYAMIIYAGLDGIEKKLQPTPPADGDFADDGKLEKLPDSLSDAKEKAKNSSFVNSLITEEIKKAYL